VSWRCVALVVSGRAQLGRSRARPGGGVIVAMAQLRSTAAGGPASCCSAPCNNCCAGGGLLGPRIQWTASCHSSPGLLRHALLSNGGVLVPGGTAVPDGGGSPGRACRRAVRGGCGAMRNRRAAGLLQPCRAPGSWIRLRGGFAASCAPANAAVPGGDCCRRVHRLFGIGCIATKCCCPPPAPCCALVPAVTNGPSSMPGGTYTVGPGIQSPCSEERACVR